jgi:SAM-dependent methyltransferase
MYINNIIINKKGVIMSQKKWILPDGREDHRYLNEDQEWPTLYTRLGMPRILDHCYIEDVKEYIGRKDNPSDFSFLDAGCGHGNDLRAFRKLLASEGRYLGLDISRAEILRGLDFYQDRDGENPEEAIKLFGLANLQDLSQIFLWDNEDQGFSFNKGLLDEEFDLVYTEAVLHSFGYGYKYYEQKKAAARRALNEFFRVCKRGGIYFGRTTVFKSSISKEAQLRCLIDEEDWRFIPGAEELLEMFRQAGFDEIKNMLSPHPKAKINLSRKDMLTISFLLKK